MLDWLIAGQYGVVTCISWRHTVARRAEAETMEVPGISWVLQMDGIFGRLLVPRRFGQLNARVLLLMQDRIVRKEDILEDLDDTCRKGTDEEGDCSSLRFEPCANKEKLLDELIPMLKQYSMWLLAA